MKKINPFVVFVLLFLALAGCQNSKKDTEQAKEVALTFAYDFFNLKERTSAYDIGGLEYVDPDIVEGVSVLAHSQLYVVYDEIVQKWGADALPEVNQVNVLSVSTNQEKYQYPHFIFDIQVTYEKTGSVLDVNEITVVVGNIKNVWQITGIGLHTPQEE